MKKIVISLLVFSMAVMSFAAGKKAAKEEAIQKAGFETKLNVGLALTDGNSETLTANGALVTTGEKEGLGSVVAGVEANYGETTTEDADTMEDVTDTTVNNLKAYGNLKKTLSPRTFVSGDASVLYDEIALIDYRAIAGLGLGAYLVKNNKRELTLEAGPAYLWEKVDGVSDDYLTVWFGQRYTCQATKTAKLVQTLKYTPEASDFDNYLLVGEIGIEAALSDRLSLRVVLSDTYDSTPAAGKEHNDLSLVAGLGLTL